MSVRVLFVCLGNICRSPAAEAVMNRLIQQIGLNDKIIIESAGTGGYHVGEFADPRMVSAGQKRGYEFLSKARKVYPPQDFEEFDYIMAADNANLADLRKLMNSPTELDGKLYLMSEFGQKHKGIEVPDPYFGGNDGFDHVLDILEDACSGLLDHIKTTRL